MGNTIITDRERPSFIWTWAVYYEGLTALYKIYSKKEYYHHALDWTNFHDWRSRSGNETRNVDDYCAAQTYIYLYSLQPEPENLKTPVQQYKNFSTPAKRRLGPDNCY